MSANDVYIFEVSQSSFPSAVLQNSSKLPVFVEFMSMWSEHCIQMDERLAKLAREFAGQFIFARVDIEEQRELREQYQIKNVPTLKVFKDGAEVLSMEGVIEEHELRTMLRSYNIFHESDEMREQAREKHLAGDTVGAINLLTKAIQKDPSNTRVAMDMVQIFIDMGELEQALALFRRLPEADRNSETGRVLSGQLTFKQLAANTEGKTALQSRLENNTDDHDARFDLAVCLVAEYDYKTAVEQLFTILAKAPDYRDGAAREMIVNVANMLAPNEQELAQSFRRRLANTLL